MTASPPLQAGDRVRCKLPGYAGMTGTIDTLERAQGGAECAWVAWSDLGNALARTGAYFLLANLERIG